MRILDSEGNTAQRPVRESSLSADAAEKGDYAHYMLKEIYEQPRAIAQTLEERVAGGKLLEAAFGPLATEVFRRTEAVQIVACGTSYHAGAVAKYYIEQIARLPCWVEIASEYRYRNPVVPKNTLFVTISQSGETADTLAALRMAKQSGYLSSLSICNVPESSLVRESELVLLTRAGPEIGVASTKAFTTQLAALGMLVVALAKFNGTDAERERGLVQRLIEIPGAGREDAASRRRRSRSWRSASPTSITRCSSAAARCIRSRWKARSSSRKSPTSTPRRIRPASSSTVRSRWSTPTCRSSRSRRTTTCSRS